MFEFWRGRCISSWFERHVPNCNLSKTGVPFIWLISFCIVGRLSSNYSFSQVFPIPSGNTSNGRPFCTTHHQKTCISPKVQNSGRSIFIEQMLQINLIFECPELALKFNNLTHQKWPLLPIRAKIIWNFKRNVKKVLRYKIAKSQ